MFRRKTLAFLSAGLALLPFSAHAWELSKVAEPITLKKLVLVVHTHPINAVGTDLDPDPNANLVHIAFSGFADPSTAAAAMALLNRSSITIQ